MSQWGAQSMVDPLKRVILKAPAQAYRSDETVAAQWEMLNYRSAPNMQEAVSEHQGLVSMLEGFGAEVLLLPEDQTTSLDSIYTYDTSLALDDGLVLLQMGKQARVPEADALAKAAAQWDIPVVGRVEGAGTADSGDLMWLDHNTLLVGRGFRTNAAGTQQLREILEPRGITVIEVHLPVWRGRAFVLHLMSLISLVDHDLAVIHSNLMPVPLFQLLEERNITTVEVTEDELEKQGCNILAVEPRKLMMVEGTPRVADELTKLGCEIHTFKAAEIAVKGDGGPTCLTRPLLRTR